MKLFNNQYTKRILSGVTGLILAVTPMSFAKATKITLQSNGQEITIDVPSNASLKVNNDGTYQVVFDGEEVVNNSEITYEEAVQERVTLPMTMEEFNEILRNANNTLTSTKDFNIYPSYRFMGTDTYLDQDMQRDMKCLTYYTNSEYICGTSLEKELVNSAYINEYNFYNDPNIMTNTYSAYNLINQIADYNHRTIASLKCSKDGEIASREMQDNGVENLIDVSVFCRDEHDRKVLHEQYLNLKKLAYALISGDEEAIKEATDLNYTSFTTLNSNVTTNNNSASISVGANWLNTVANGTTFITWMETYLDNKYSRKELSNYFDSRFLNLNQWFIIGEYEALLNPENNPNSFAIEYDKIDDGLLNQILVSDSTMHYFVYHTGNIALTNLLGEQVNYSKTKTK